MANIYDRRRYGVLLFLIISVGVVVLFLYVSNSLVKDLSEQERDRMQIWADATKEIVNIGNASVDDSTSISAGIDIDFLLNIIERNRTIPVLWTDDKDNILGQKNFDLPEAQDPIMPYTELNQQFLNEKLADLKNSSNIIVMDISPDNRQYLYYEDSKLLQRLSYYPYVQLLVMLAFIAVVYFAVLSTKKAEQNKVWVGLSKETAHQLGTPISSLMAWMELLESLGVDAETVAEMNKDVKRLSTIASRFSKIGSKPQMESENLNDAVARSSSYMSSRISSRINLTVDLDSNALPAMISAPLFEWVMENLIKNAVDAMEGSGAIAVTTGKEKDYVYVEVADTGKGISRKNFKTIFNPGYTTKKRGWGLGLTLAKRIIEQYHAGKIYVKTSEPGIGTTFRIDLPLSH
ncbi:MAG: ATP-binding protein [Muribaculaceae bacterium]|nr:ATP-binding protein [Muribaculaceae bacterium]MBR1963396.1 ATP-binding protein [Muribaculaceae bacterium]